MPTCFACQKDVSILDRVGRSETCLACGADLHSCRNCQFYDPLAYNECRETSAERVLEKDRANFCDHFVFGDHKASENAKAKADEARRKLEELFKKK